MKHGCKVERKSQTKRVSQLLSEGQHIVTPLQGLVWIAKKPRRPRRIGGANDSWVLAVEEGIGTVPLGTVKCNAVLEVVSALGELSKQEQAAPECIMS